MEDRVVCAGNEERCALVYSCIRCVSTFVCSLYEKILFFTLLFSMAVLYGDTHGKRVNINVVYKTHMTLYLNIIIIVRVVVCVYVGIWMLFLSCDDTSGCMFDLCLSTSLNVLYTKLLWFLQFFSFILGT